MCGRFNLRTPMNVLAQQFMFELGPQPEAAFRPRWNIAPTQLVAGVRKRAAGEPKRELAWLRWGLIPSWAKDPKIAYSTINARADSLADKPMFRGAFQRRRCLILADGFYEWKKEGKKRIPWHFHLAPERPFAFAGLWETWHGPPPHEGPPLESCTLITTDANKLCAQVHDRMPVILLEADYDLWLDPQMTDKARLARLLVPYPAEEMAGEPVSDPEILTIRRKPATGEAE
jgi:putative SOS response-associated peptidase YedK